MSDMEQSQVYMDHDRFFRKNMSHLETARDFFAMCLPPDLYACLDWSRLAPIKNDQIDRQGREVLTDMLFSAPLHDVDSRLLLLMEHKSEGAMKKQEHTLPFLLRRNEVRVMEDTRVQDTQKGYPVIHLLGLYHGSKAYRGPMSVAESMEAPHGQAPERWREPMHLVDLEDFSDEALLHSGRMGLFLMALKHIYNPNLGQILPSMAPLVMEMDKADGSAEFVNTLFEYLFHKSDLKKEVLLHAFEVQSYERRAKERVMTLAERIWEEGAASERAKRLEAEAQFQEERARVQEERAQWQAERAQWQAERAKLLKEHRRETHQFLQERALALLGMGMSIENVAIALKWDKRKVAALVKRQKSSPVGMEGVSPE